VQIMEIRLLRAHAGLCGFAVAARAAPTGGCGRLRLVGSDCRSGASRDRATYGYDANARGWRCPQSPAHIAATGADRADSAAACVRRLTRFRGRGSRRSYRGLRAVTSDRVRL